MKKSLEEIKIILNQNLEFLRKTHNVERIGVFGSVVTGENRETSDVDILVEFSESPSFFKFLDLEDYLSKVIGKKVDLVTKKALKPIIKEEILKEVVYV